MADPGESNLAREMFAQPELLARFRAREGARAVDLGAQLGARRPAGVLIAARGSSDHAAVYAKYLFGARLGVTVALAAQASARKLADAIADRKSVV